MIRKLADKNCGQHYKKVNEKLDHKSQGTSMHV